MEAGGLFEGAKPHATSVPVHWHEITGCPTFSEVHVGDGRNKALSNFGKRRIGGVLDIETVNPTCIQSWRAFEGFGVRDTVKGMVPGHVCIVQVCFTQTCA